MHEDSAHYPPLDPVRAGMKGLCPRCGQGRLFNGLMTLRPACTVCGLDYGFAEPGDGPVVFVAILAGAIVLGGALWLQARFDPPLWVHFLLWTPLAAIVTLGLTRMIKGILIDLQYRNKAGQGEIDRG